MLNEVSIFACDLANGTFEIKITNTGDYNESISLDTRGLPSGITAVFSDDEFDLNAGKSTIVYLSVHASYGVSLGEKSFYVEADAGSEDYDKKLEFEVLEAPEAEEKIRGVLQIVSYPQDLKITSGEETEVEVMLYNDSDEEITVVETTSVDAPNAIYMFFPQTNVPAKETVTVKGKLVAGSSVDAGNYSFRLVSYSKDYIDEKIVSVEVESSNDSDDGDDGNDDEENGFFAGLITLGAFIPGIGGGVSILILAVVIIYVGYLLLRRDKIEENNKWMLYKKQGF